MMAKKRSEEIETSLELWTLEKSSDLVVFRAERRWWKWPPRKLLVFLLGFAVLGGVPLFAGFMWASESMYVFDGEQVVVHGESSAPPRQPGRGEGVDRARV